MTRNTQEQDRADSRRLLRCRLLRCRLVGYGIPCLVILLLVGGWLWRLHNPDPGDSFPELRRSSGGEVQL
jgi:hypothetical protein